MRSQGLGGVKQKLLANVRLLFSFALQKPVGKKFKLDVRDAIVIEKLLHFAERARFQNVFQVGVPDSKSFETRSGSGFYAVAKAERSLPPVRVRDSTGNRPVRR